MITKEETTYLKAIAIILIILSHFWGWIAESTQILKVIGSSLAQSAVFLFLFLSGYGVMQSYLNKGIENFWKRRLLKIYVPFLLISLPELLLEIWHYRQNIQDMYIRSTFLSALGLFPDNLLDGTFWFISFILLQYAAFYISFRIKANRGVQRCVHIILVLIVYCVFKQYFTWTCENDIYGFGFLLGSVLPELKDTKPKSKKINMWFIAAMSFAGYIFTLMRFENAGYRFLNCLCLCFIEIVSVMAFYHLRGEVKWLKWIGVYSYELYLTEGFFFWHKALYDMVGYNYLGLALHFCVILILSIFIQKISMKISNVLSQNIQIGDYKRNGRYI